ncbi:MAG: hypothetical protein RLZ56_1157 [Bacteroidota bacterium]|jgi:uncharacterized protein YdeI (YjbR/CyaY-like superfamily)
MHVLADSFFEKANNWKQEFLALRAIVQSCKLSETIKWKHPCYTNHEANIVLIHGFKDYCALLFFKGALLKDPKKILVQQTKNVQAARQIRFNNVQDILKSKAIIKSYIKEAVQIELAGLEVAYKETNNFEVPHVIEDYFKKNKLVQKAFYALSPGRQKGYLLHFASAKQVSTQLSRIEAVKQKILCGKGLNDCTCGLSKRMPNCDGSHKFI